MECYYEVSVRKNAYDDIGRLVRDETIMTQKCTSFFVNCKTDNLRVEYRGTLEKEEETDA